MTSSSDIAVLMYHSVATDSTPAFNDFVVSPERFSAQICALADAGFTTVTMSDLAAARASNHVLPARTVALTFDDGFLDFAETALPILQSHHFTATLYMTTRFIGGSSRWLAPEGEADRRMLSWADLETLVAGGVEVGAHSDTHPQLDLVTPQVLARELMVPKVTLEDRLGVPVNSMAYPFGYSTRQVRRMTAHLGYTNGCVVSDLVSAGEDHLYSIPRLTVTDNHSGSDVVCMSGRSSTRRERTNSQLRHYASLGLRRAGVKKKESAVFSRSMR
ncbi:MAG: polysaccharide deacetylase family protein [Pseudolysinimonas sp.]